MKRDESNLQNIEENQQDDEESREMPSVNSTKRSSNGPLQKLLILILAVAVIIALAAVNGLFGKKEAKKGPERVERVGSNLPPPPDLPKEPEKPKEPAVPLAPVKPTVIETGRLVPPPPPPPMRTTQEKRPPTPDERKMQPNLVAFSGGKAGQQATQGQQNIAGARASLDGGEQADDLSAKLKAAKVMGSRASVLHDRTFFVTQGQFLDCVLETAIDSTVSGMVRARLSKNVYSADGRMILLERGTKIVGQYQRGMKQGEARLFVLWTRAETPQGVLINLDSPGTDELGRAGFDGYIDTHFWARFGSAIMFSMIDDVGSYLIDLAKEQNGNNTQQLNLTSTGDTAKQTAGIALEHSINIPPTLRKNQGDAISIFVARDLDFRGVYAIDFE